MKYKNTIGFLILFVIFAFLGCSEPQQAEVGPVQPPRFSKTPLGNIDNWTSMVMINDSLTGDQYLIVMNDFGKSVAIQKLGSLK